MIYIQDIISDAGKWSSKKTEICRNLNPEFQNIYDLITESVDEYCIENNINLTSLEDLQAVVQGVSVLFLGTEEKDVYYYAIIAVISDYIDLSMF